MTKELEEFLSSTFILRQTLLRVMSVEAVDYILTLIAKDGAHRKLMKLMEIDESSDNQNAGMAE